MPEERFHLPFEDELKFIIKRYMTGSLAHGFEHVMRVVDTCKYIASECEKIGEHVDSDTLITAAYLHDIGRVKSLADLVDKDPPLDENHAVRSAFYTKQLLKRYSWIPESKIENVLRIIQAHSFSLGKKPLSLEEKILSDADKLDAIGSWGIIRTILHTFENGLSFSDMTRHLKVKILKLHDLLQTTPARKLGKKKHEIVEQFMRDLEGY
ncbi:MAG: HD domain-containing protein [Promethearchaeota archaeon]